MNMTDMQEIKLSIKAAKDKIRKGELLIKLEKNAAFRELFLDDYLRDRAVALAKQSVRASLNDVGSKVHHNALIGIGALHDYMQAIYTEASAAHQAMQGYEAELALGTEEVEDHE